MALKDYSTTVPASRTVAEIQSMLTDHGAIEFSIRNNERREPIEIAFALPTSDGYELQYRLPANVDGVHHVLQEQAARGALSRSAAFFTRDQATRVAWRILRDWIAAQLAVVEAGALTDEQAFLGFIQVRGRPLYELLEEQRFLALPPGREEAQ